MIPNIVIAGAVVAFIIYKQFYPTRFTHQFRRDMRRLLKLESDEEFLKGALSEQAEVFTEYARRRNPETTLRAPVQEHGYVYVARVAIRDDRIPRGHNVKDWDKTFKRFTERLCQSSNDSLFKIGFTQRAPEERINELNDDDRDVSGSIYWPYTFDLVWSIRVKDCAGVEAKAHKALCSKRVAGEIFYATEEEAIDAVIRSNTPKL